MQNSLKNIKTTCWNWTPGEMYSTLSTAQLFDAQTLREWLALLQTCRGSSCRCAFLSETWAASTLNTCMWTPCVRSPPTKYCSRVASMVCASCRCTPHSSPHTSPTLFEWCTAWHLTCTPTRCCSSCGNRLMITISWCRCAAKRANGSKCSASTPEFVIIRFIFLTLCCATLVCCSTE